MMLHASPLYYQPMYTPTIRSPLAERPTNVPPRTFSFTMGSPSPASKTPVPQRTHKPNPVVQSREAATQRRRDLFFRRVQKERDDKRWDSRGEQIQRLDWVSEQKQWEAEKARQAPELKDDFIEEQVAEEATTATASSMDYDPRSEQEMAEAEYILAQEERELQALIAAMEEEEQVPDNASQHYGSDVDDYDQIFMECTSSENAQQSGFSNSDFHDPDAMDTSDG